MDEKQAGRSLWVVLRRAVDGARDDDVPMVAQALAYSLFLAIPAIVLLALGVFSLVADAQTVDQLMGRLGGVMPEEAITLLRQSLDRSTQSHGGGLAMAVLGFGLALWTTTSAASTLMTATTKAFDREDQRGFLRKRLLALAIVLALGIGAALMLSLLVFGPHLERWIGGATGVPTLFAWLWWTLQWPLLVAGLLFAFAVALALGPDVDQRRWQFVTPGAVTALLLWLVASAGFAVYTARFGSYDKTWGTISAVVITLIWLWLTSAAILFGAEINAEAQRLERRRGSAESQRAAA
ncbi:MAG TPA: YihY/virulence factor BrkB family protein [Gaiella sp.]|nr:YihY/virulence factor BrkB family protein [Gaiella sp.]